MKKYDWSTNAMSKKTQVQVEDPDRKLSLNILQLITEIQSQNGLSTGNYIRYRQYCTRRLHRLRKGLDCTHGKKKYLVKEIDISDMNDERYLMLPLLKSERAWAYATEIKSEGIEKRALKQHFKKRLNKALHWSDELFKLSKEKADDRTIFEAQAYHGWIKGLVLLESEKWEEAIENFIHSKTIYDQLGKGGKYIEKEMYSKRIQKDLEPSIRFCQYNLSKDTKELSSIVDDIENVALDLLKSKLDDVLEESRKKQVETLEEIEFLGKKVHLRNDKIKRNIIQIEANQLELEKTNDDDLKLKFFDKILFTYSDVLGMIKDDIKQKSLQNTSTEEFMNEMRTLHSYISYQSNNKVIDRNLIMINTILNDKKNTTKSVGVARLYEIILQNLSDMENLPGIDEQKEILTEIKVKEMFYKAKRCFYIAKSFEETGKWKEAAGLYGRSEELAGSARVLIENSKLKFDISELLETIRKQRCILSATKILTKHSILEEKKVNAKNPIMKNLDDFVVDQYGKPILSTFPPEYEAIPCQPVFLDKAINYVNYPEIKKENKGWFSTWF